MSYREFKGKNVDEAITNACVELGLTDKGSINE